MASVSNRVAGIVAPHVRLSSGLGAAIDETVERQGDCQVDRCAESLQLLGRMGSMLQADPCLLRSLLADDATIRAHPAIHDLARWLGDGAPEPLRLRIPPVVVSVVRAPHPAVFEVVEFRRPMRRKSPTGTVPEDDVIEIFRLVLDVSCTAEAAATAARITNPDRRCLLHNLVAAIFMAVTRVGTVAMNDEIEPGLQLHLTRAIVDALRTPGRIPTVAICVHGLEVRFRLGLEPDHTLPFRIVEVREVA